MTPPGMEEMSNQLSDMFKNIGKQQKTKQKMTIAEALVALAEEEADKLVHTGQVGDVPHTPGQPHRITCYTYAVYSNT